MKGRTLEKALSRAARLLPKWAHREGTYLVHAQQFTGHPKLRLMIDDAKVTKAHAILIEHLKTIDPSERRKTKVLGVSGSISFNVLLVVGAFVASLVWRGYV